MLADLILAGATVVVVALRPRSWAATSAAASLAGVELGVSGVAALIPALRAAWPMLALLTATLSASAFAVRLGAAERTASALACGSRGSTTRLYVLVCGLCALLTSCLTLDGAVVLLVPVVVALERRFSVPRRPLLLGVVAVANAFSAAFPIANPANLVVLARLGLGFGEATAHLLPAAIVAACLCAVAVGVSERRTLRTRLREAPAGAEPVPRVAAGLPAVARVGLQIVALLVVLPSVVRPGQLAWTGLAGLLALALAATALASLANNLPASAVAAVALVPGPGAYAALVGLSVGALVTPHGSVATLIAGDLAEESPHARILAPAALAATAAAVAILWLGG